MKKIYLLLFTFVTVCSYVQAQDIRGTIKDALSKETLVGATIQIEGLEGKSTITNAEGIFHIKNVPVGRYNIKASYVGYQPGIFAEILISSSKETVLDIELEQHDNSLNEIVVLPVISKQKALNPMAIVGAKMFSVEEASRYAGGFDDPARLASSYSGIANTGTQNGISIHGNSPHLVQWHIEGVEMPAPNHLSDAYYEGGGVISALSSQVMGNSDFLSAAFPAEYGNALSGVFDVKLRKGNEKNYEHTFQVGTVGLEGASEGPINKEKGSSYIVNYRFATLGIVNELGVINTGDVINYQDLNFKLNFPTKNAGEFSIYGIGWTDHAYVVLDEPKYWKNVYDQNNTDVKQYSGMGGINHSIDIGKKGKMKTTISYSYLKTKINDSYKILNDFYDKESGIYIVDYGNMEDIRNTFSIATNYSTRIVKNTVWTTGLNYSLKSFNYDLQMANYIGSKDLYKVKDFDENTSLLSGYTEILWNANNYFTINCGLFSQYLTINEKGTIEPRASIRWRPNDADAISFGYAYQSMIDRMDCLFENRNLGFMHSNQLMLTYSHNFNEKLNFKVETYLQLHGDVPVGVGDEAAYCVLNRFDYYEDHKLVNDGKGRVYGIDLSLEKYMSNGFYYQGNVSLFKSEYQGGDKVWHDTRFNRGYIVKALGGKEWFIGSNNKNILNISAKVTYMGGLRYSPINETASRSSVDYEVVFDESKAFSEQLDPDLNIDFTISYKINKTSTSHEFALKWLNVTNSGAYMKHVYNYIDNKFEPYMISYTFPNLCYKFCF